MRNLIAMTSMEHESPVLLWNAIDVMIDKNKTTDPIGLFISNADKIERIVASIFGPPAVMK
jgi:hypothetical protein